MNSWIVRRMALVVLAGSLMAAAVGARAADDGPRLPCGVAPLPAFAEPGTPPNVRSWTGNAARRWTPPACIESPPMEADMIIALAGSFRFEGGLDALCARVGAISSKKGVRYWSTTEKTWQPLVADAYAVSGPDPGQRRADFAPDQFAKGASLYHAQSDNRTTGTSVYRERVVAAERERLIVVSENVTPLKKMMVTLFEPGGMQTVYIIERRAPGAWNFYSLTRTRLASALLPVGSEASYINRAAAFYRHVAGIPTDQEPPAAR